MMSNTYEVTHEVDAAALMVRVKGKFDRDAAQAVEQLVKAHEGVRVLNLSAVDYISSSGIAGLVKMSASAGLRVADLAECVRHALSLAGIERILSIYPDEESARAPG